MRVDRVAGDSFGPFEFADFPVFGVGVFADDSFRGCVAEADGGIDGAADCVRRRVFAADGILDGEA